MGLRENLALALSPDLSIVLADIEAALDACYEHGVVGVGIAAPLLHAYELLAGRPWIEPDRRQR